MYDSLFILYFMPITYEFDFQRETYKSRGGQLQIHPSTISSKVIAMMGHRFEAVEFLMIVMEIFPVYQLQMKIILPFVMMINLLKLFMVVDKYSF